MVRKQKEKLVGKIMVLLFVAFSTTGHTQNESYINPGLLSASATLSPAIMLNRSETNYYLSGFLEGRVSKHTAFRGEIHYMLGNSNTKFLRNSLRTSFGMQYGIPIKNFEIHFGFAPGCALIQSYQNPTKTEFIPSFQLNLGVRYYVWKYFHFFSNFSYFNSKMNTLVSVNARADELFFTVGLGYNFQVLKKYR